MTKDGIEYNLSITPYVVNKEYNAINVIFKFSSEMYRDKFSAYMNDTALKNDRNSKTLKKYGFLFENHLVEDIRKYTTLEKRGFQIIMDSKKFESVKDIKLDILYVV
jgi:hypothetical protein